MRRVDELRPIEPGTLAKVCEVLGLDPSTTAHLDITYGRALAVVIDDGQMRTVELIES